MAVIVTIALLLIGYGLTLGAALAYRRRALEAEAAVRANHARAIATIGTAFSTAERVSTGAGGSEVG